MEKESEVNSDDELFSLLQSSGDHHSYFPGYDINNIVTEYSKYGIFKVKDANTELGRSKLYLEFVCTLKHLSDACTIHEYMRFLYDKDRTNMLKNVNFSRSDRFEDNAKHYEVLIHRRPYHLIGKCTLREVDGPVSMGSANSDNLSMRSVYSAVISSGILDVLPSLGYKMMKQHNVVSQVFHINYGSHNYVQVSLYRYYDLEKELFPGTLLTEIRCFGNSEIEFYKNLTNTFAKLLYKFVQF
ncbi:hypothetical protein MACJ_000180 [Theileria orientalis]|uniref:Uncharacterized protein n=1 Tax=Theileria orientalis TaxID=68886 RepID=A0A976M4T7_THEOR|nr:hypothetical protein MACJ_000180 [Theileria orientalis]